MQRIAPYLVGLLVLSAATGCTKKKDTSSTSAASTSSGTSNAASTSTSTGTSSSSTSASSASGTTSSSSSSSTSTGSTTGATLSGSTSTGSNGTSTHSSSGSSGTLSTGSTSSSGTGSTGSTSGSSSGSSSGSTGLTRAQFCAQAEPLLCQLAATCQATDPATANCNTLIANVATELLGCSGQTAADEQQGLVRYDPTATGACLTALQSVQGCSTLGQAALASACSTSKIFKGVVPVGGTCAETSDCEPAALADGGAVSASCYTDQLSATCSQTCRSNARQLGEDCDPYTPGVFCVAGGCNPDPNGGPIFNFVGTSGYVCSNYVATGGSCDYYNPCDPSRDYCQQIYDADAGLPADVCAARDAAQVCGTAECNVTSGANCSCPLGTVCSPSPGVQTVGSCQAPAGLGDACDDSIISQPCAADLVCAPTHGSTGASTCVHRTASLGEACNPNYGSNCVTGAYCAGTATQVCITEASLGQPCDFSAGNCPPGLQCQSAGDGGATCSPLAREGEDCSNASCRTLLQCNVDTDGGYACQPRKVLGDACDPSTDYCYGSYCDLATRHCATYLPTGSVCNPQEYSACGRQYCVYVEDGGAVCSTECFFPDFQK